MSVSPRLALSFVLIAALAAFAPFGQARAQDHGGAASALRSASFDGKWSGKAKCLYDPQMWPEDECDVGFDFVIEGTHLQATQTIRSKKGEATSSALAPMRFKRELTNALAYSIESGQDEDGTWVETIAFVLTLKDPDHLIVHWTRVVNNIDVPLAKKGSKFSSVGMGEMVRSR